VQHLAGIGIDQQRCFDPGVSGRGCGENGSGKGRGESLETERRHKCHWARSGLLFAGLGSSVVSPDVWNI
jgi:hypothetical protein